MMWGIKIFFLIALTGSFILDAMYVECVIRINKDINNQSQKIPGVQENDVKPNEVIPYYIAKLKTYINGQATEQQKLFTNAIQILNEYEKYSEQQYPVEQDKASNSRSKVDFFFKKICYSINTLQFPSTLTFFCFHYIKRYEETKDQLSDWTTVYQQQYQELEKQRNRNHTVSSEISSLKSEIEKITQKEKTIEKLTLAQKKHEQEKSELTTNYAKEMEQKDKQIKELTQQNATQKAELAGVYCKQYSNHVERNSKESSILPYVATILLISNLFFMYKYLTK